MNPKLAKLLVRLYPRAWRERYGDEFLLFLEAEPGSLRSTFNVLHSATHEHILPTRRKPSAKVPHRHGILFVVRSLAVLAAFYFAACFLLWEGWHIFRPFENSPFGLRFEPIFSLANIYFQADRLFYLLAPLLAGWIVALTGARQRVRPVWLMTSVSLISVLGASAQIQASRATVAHAMGHIRMTVLPTAPQLPFAAMHAMVLFGLSLIPYFVWRIRNRNTRLV